MAFTNIREDNMDDNMFIASYTYYLILNIIFRKDNICLK